MAQQSGRAVRVPLAPTDAGGLRLTGGLPAILQPLTQPSLCEAGASLPLGGGGKSAQGPQTVPAPLKEKASGSFP